ncbi:predicted protein [Postia placenta Mad-698-R]|nr:predicted protein [Postia placenta Mad-698-R]
MYSMQLHNMTILDYWFMFHYLHSQDGPAASSWYINCCGPNTIDGAIAVVAAMFTIMFFQRHQQNVVEIEPFDSSESGPHSATTHYAVSDSYGHHPVALHADPLIDVLRDPCRPAPSSTISDAKQRVAPPLMPAVADLRIHLGFTRPGGRRHWWSDDIISVTCAIGRCLGVLFQDLGYTRLNYIDPLYDTQRATHKSPPKPSRGCPMSSRDNIHRDVPGPGGNGPGDWSLLLLRTNDHRAGSLLTPRSNRSQVGPGIEEIGPP